METSADTLPKLETLHFVDVDHSLIFMFASIMYVISFASSCFSISPAGCS